MTSLNALLTILTSFCVIMTALVAAVFGIFRMGGATNGLKAAVLGNTRATDKLTGQMNAFAAETVKTLADHEMRIVKLETPKGA